MFVQWNSSKFHILNRSGCKIQESERGPHKVSSSPGRQAKTDCGTVIPDNSDCFLHLPANADPRLGMCHKCDAGVGFAKPDPAEEQTREAEKSAESKKSMDKIKKRMNDAARELFDKMK